MSRASLSVALLCIGTLMSQVPAGSAELKSARVLESGGAAASLGARAANNEEIRQSLRALRSEAANRGAVAVAVKLAVPFAPEKLLTETEKQKQLRDITAAVNALRQAMPQARNFEAQPGVPYVLMQLDRAGLDRLETVPGIVQITKAQDFNWPRDFMRLSATFASAIPGQEPPLAVVRPAVVGGTNANMITHPFQVALFKDYSFPNGASGSFFYCGGSLISERFIVTAAHCSDLFNSSELSVSVGSRSVSEGRRIRVASVHIHPEYSREGRKRDVAVWELAEAVTDVPLGTLASTQPTTPGTPLRATGWGIAGGTQGGNLTVTYPDKLQMVDLPFVPMSVDRRCAGIPERLDASMLCAGASGQSICIGDGGSPLTIDRGSGRREIVGVASWWLGDCFAGTPSVFANIAYTSTRAFIDSVVNRGEIGFQQTRVDIKEGLPPFTPVAASGSLQDTLRAAVNAGRLTLTVTRTSAVWPASVNYTTGGGDARPLPLNITDGFNFSPDTVFHYAPVSGTLHFAAGQTTATIVVPIIDNDVWDREREFNVTLSRASAGFVIGNGTLTVRIQDNDRP